MGSTQMNDEKDRQSAKQQNPQDHRVQLCYPVLRCRTLSGRIGTKEWKGSWVKGGFRSRNLEWIARGKVPPLAPPHCCLVPAFLIFLF